MKLERLHEYIIPTVATLAGMLLAVKMGSLTGQGSMGAMTIILIGVASVALCIWLRTKTWILIALTWDLTGIVPVTNLPLGVRDMVVGLVAGSYLIFYALKMIRGKGTLDAIDWLIGGMILYLLTVYIRNPVGVAAVGSSKVGGRPYFDVFVAFVAYFVLSRAPVDFTSLRRLPIFLLAGTAITSLGSLVTYVIPRSTGLLSELYSGFAPPQDTIQEQDATARKQGLSLGSNTGMRVLCSYFPPITLISPVFFWRFLAATLCIIGVLLSGFRSSFITVILYVFASSFFRRRIRDIAVIAAIGFFLVLILALGNRRVFDLPLSVQRALTIFPGNWDTIAVEDAKESTQWRVDMWKIALTEDRYIKDRIFGDGYGFTRVELAIMESSQRGGPGFVGGARQEGFLISGMFHSGPLSTIRYVGYIGLFVYTSLIILLAVRGWKLIRSTENTELFAPALFVGMPVVIAPFIFYLLAGAFQYNLPDSIFAAGLLKLMERGLGLRAKLSKETGEDSLPSARRRRFEDRPLVPAHIRT